MAIAESPSDALALPSGGAIAHRPMGIFGRPRAKTGWTSWITTVDHKRIGIMYGAAALFFFCIGGLQALLIRAPLAAPGQQLFSADLYTQISTIPVFTMRSAESRVAEDCVSTF